MSTSLLTGRSPEKCPLYSAVDPGAPSTGGLVLKRALVIAVRRSVMEPEDDLLSPDGPGDDRLRGNTYTDIIKHCHSIAFFGTPRK